MRLRSAALCLGLSLALPATAAPPALHEAAYQDTASMLARLAPDADPRVIALALQARDCAASALGQPAAPRLAVIDYSRPSTEPRLWVFDLAGNTLLFHEVVAHGQGDDPRVGVGREPGEHGGGVLISGFVQRRRRGGRGQG